MDPLFIAVGVGVVALLMVILTYNGMVSKKNQVDNVFASLDALLKKRYDLIPNLVASTQQYMTHEKDTLTQITALRAKATEGQMAPDEKVQLDQQMTQLLGGIRVAVESYPQLKADQSFDTLMRSLNEIEEQISAGRRAYNATVTDYNNALDMFPTNLVAGMMGLSKRTWFEAKEAERENVDVKAMFKS